jgi:hypothetical protein
MFFPSPNGESIGCTVNEWFICAGLHDLGQRTHAVDVAEGLGGVEDQPVGPIPNVVA